MPIKAAIDIGTNSTRLLVAELTDRQTKDLHREARITRLGQDVDKTKLLAAEAINRTVNVVLDYINIAKKLGAETVTISATSAARDAKNIDDFIENIKSKTSLQLKVLSAEQEASLSFLGATYAFLPLEHQPRTLPDRQAGINHKSLPFLVLDIGGGSTELILGKSGTVPKPIERGLSPIALSYSKDIGSVRLAEMFIKNDPPLENELQKTADYIKQAYDEPVSEIKRIAPTLQMIGTAGTTTTLAALNLGLEDYTSEKVHGSTLSLESIEKLFNKLKKMTVTERKEINVIQPGRADVIVTGSLILLTLMKMLKAHELIVSEQDILDGLLLTF